MQQNSKQSRTSTPTQPMHASGRNIPTTRCPRTGRLLRNHQRDILISNVIARMHVGATNTSRAVTLLRTTEITGEIDVCDVADLHQAGADIGSVVTVVLSDDRTRVCTLDNEIGKQHVADAAPAAASREEIGFVRVLGDQCANPCLDVGAVVHVFVVPDDLMARGQCFMHENVPEETLLSASLDQVGV